MPIPLQRKVIRIDFDGGTPCNIPPNYGTGYGSYGFSEYDGSSWRTFEPTRVNHGQPMSNNAAEIWTLVVALRDAIDQLEPVLAKTDLTVRGDSAIVIRKVELIWAKQKVVWGKESHPLFISGIAELQKLIPRFSFVTAKWHGRENNVQMFGH